MGPDIGMTHELRLLLAPVLIVASDDLDTSADLFRVAPSAFVTVAPVAGQTRSCGSAGHRHAGGLTPLPSDSRRTPGDAAGSSPARQVLRR
jgi:hypothetical protein